MTTDIRFLRSSAASMRAKAEDLASGQPMINTEPSDPGLYFRLDDGTLMKAGPTHIGNLPPNYSASGGGQTGNSIGEMWLDTSLSEPLLKVFTSLGWVVASGLDGDKGQKGQSGTNGAAGSDGDKGQKGEPGSVAAKGDKGPKGDKGAALGSIGINDLNDVNIVTPSDHDRLTYNQLANKWVAEPDTIGGAMIASVIPDTNAAYDLGNAEFKIRHLFLSDNSIKFGDAQLSLGVNEGDLEFGGIPIMPRTLDNVLTTLGVSSYDDNDAAIAGGLDIGDVYYNTTGSKLTSVTV